MSEDSEPLTIVESFTYDVGRKELGLHRLSNGQLVVDASDISRLIILMGKDLEEVFADLEADAK